MDSCNLSKHRCRCLHWGLGQENRATTVYGHLQKGLRKEHIYKPSAYIRRFTEERGQLIISSF